LIIALRSIARTHAVSFIEFGIVVAKPFDEILDQNIFVKAIYQQSHIRVAMRKHLDEIGDNGKRVCLRILGV
jgi:hypothetical protein